MKRSEGKTIEELKDHYDNCPHTIIPDTTITLPIKRFENLTSSSFVESAIKKAESLLTNNTKLINGVRGHEFKFDAGMGSDVVAKLLAKRPPIKVYYYRPWNRWSSAIGYFDGVSIFINSRKSLSFEDQVANLLHEYSHYCGFHHGDNYWSVEKSKFSVPYFISDNIKLWL